MDESTQKHHTALITGAASGLGEAMARRFAAGGWQVIIADRNIDVARRVAESLGEGNEAVALDVTEPEQWQALVEHVRETRGRLDLLVNNAGVAVGGSLEDTPAEDWRWVIDIDLMGVVWGCKAFAPMLREQGHGHVVNVSSFAGLAGAPQINAYGTAKAGVIAMSEMLRTELAPAGVHVSVLCPAFVRTNLTQTMRAPDSGYHKRVERWMDTSGVTVEDVAETVFGAVGKRRFMLLTHGNTRWLWRFKRWFPELYHRMIMRSVRKAMRRRP